MATLRALARGLCLSAYKRKAQFPGLHYSTGLIGHLGLLPAVTNEVLVPEPRMASIRPLLESIEASFIVELPIGKICLRPSRPS